MDQRTNYNNLRDGLLIIVSLVVLYRLSTYNYLFFHVLVELFSIIVAASFFLIVWNLYDTIEDNYVRILGIAYLYIAFFDLIHTIAYKGMQIFTGYDANLPTQLWITARFLESLTLLCAVFLIKKNTKKIDLVILYSTITGILIFLIFRGMFPDCYIEGQGLTLFKIYSEYTISALLLITYYLLRKNKNEFSRSLLKYITASIFFTILAELSFTFYVDVYGFSNFTGHIFKFISYYFIYKAVVESSLKNPMDTLFSQTKALSNDLKNSNHIMRHDLANNFSTISMSLDLFERHGDDKYIEIAKKASGAGLKRIAEMRSMDTGKKSTTYNVRNIIESISGEHPEINLNLQGNCNIDADDTIYSVFHNLIENALRHGKATEMDIVIDKKENRCEIRVMDNGKGIPEDIKEHIFEKDFTYGENSNTGQGLHIVKQCLNNIGASIEVEDNKPKGTVFVLKLPTQNK